MSNTRNSHQIIKSLEAQELHKRSTLQKTADRFTKWFGSAGFLFVNLIVFVIWLLINTGKLPIIDIFDPYPFILLTTVVSLEAILLTVIVLISQNRQSHVSTLREELQLQVELYQEREVSKALKLLEIILEKHGIKMADEELQEMLRDIDTSYIERKLTEQLDGKRDK